MSLDYAILGFLQYGPRSGYDLKKVFDTSVQHFWAADQAQIYRTLARLADKGWAEQEVVPQVDRPDRKEYHITDAGREALADWLRTPLGHMQPRVPHLIQLFFSGQLADPEIIAMLRTLADAVKAQLDQYDGVPDQAQPYIDEVNSPREAYFWLLTLHYGIFMARAHLSWLETTIASLEKGEVPTQ